MKKSFTFSLLFFLASSLVLAQSPVVLNKNLLPTDSAAFTSLRKAGKNGFYEWYNFIESSNANNGGAISYTIYSNNSLFPDSSMEQPYGDSSGPILDMVGLYHVGQVFDPKSFYYPEILSENTPYILDSIAIAYRYAHFVPGSVDTLRFQLFYDDALVVGSLVGSTPEPTAWIKYDTVSGKGLLAKQEWDVYLDGSDTSWDAGFATKHIGLPNIVSIKSNGLVAVAYQFIPGYSYNPGDTLDHTWSNPEVRNKINHFQPLIATDLGKTEEDSYNHGLSVRYSNKYAKAGWNTEFIPGDAWTSYNEYVYISFHARGMTSTRNPISSKNVKVYPNPNRGSESVTISYTLNENSAVSIEVYDLLGNKVQTVMNGAVEAGEQIATVDAVELEQGIYIYRITAGDQTLSGKLSIMK